MEYYSTTFVSMATLAPKNLKVPFSRLIGISMLMSKDTTFSISHSGRLRYRSVAIELLINIGPKWG